MHVHVLKGVVGQRHVLASIIKFSSKDSQENHESFAP